MTPKPAAPAVVAVADITGLVLAGGQGTRMGGADKGLQLWCGRPLAWHAAQRLAPQVGALSLNANRHLADYAAFGWPVWPDTLADHPGPLAGFLAGLARCETPYLACVPCDSPLFPPDLVPRLAQAQSRERAAVAVACAADAAGVLRRQPVFCLMHRSVASSLSDFMGAGGRKIGAWLSSVGAISVAFDRPGDAADAFANVNTLAELQALEHTHPRS